MFPKGEDAGKVGLLTVISPFGDGCLGAVGNGGSDFGGGRLLTVIDGCLETGGVGGGRLFTVICPFADGC